MTTIDSETRIRTSLADRWSGLDPSVRREALTRARNRTPIPTIDADGLWFLCEQSSWCWAAHERFAAEREEVVPDPDHPFLDLGAAETVAILAWADLVLAPALDERIPGLRSRLRREAERRVLRPFRQDRSWHWLGLDGELHNWNPWIHSHVLTAALTGPPVPRPINRGMSCTAGVGWPGTRRSRSSRRVTGCPQPRA